MPIWTPASEYGLCPPHATIDGKPVHYPVYNERAIRAGAGVMFLIGVLTMSYTFYTRDFSAISVVAPLFWFDFLIKVVRGGQYSPVGILAAQLVKGQKPEYVGAIQKRFAWSIGLFIASLMILLVLILGIRQYVPLVLCGICLLFMWMETSLGICVGCRIYSFLLDAKILPEPEIRPACPGGVCARPKK
jgi:hypothetical protein